MTRPECVFHIISCRFIALSGAFYPSYCGKWAEKAQELYLFLDHNNSEHLVAFYSFCLCHCAQQQDRLWLIGGERGWRTYRKDRIREDRVCVFLPDLEILWENNDRS